MIDLQIHVLYNCGVYHKQEKIADPEALTHPEAVIEWITYSTFDPVGSDDNVTALDAVVAIGGAVVSFKYQLKVPASTVPVASIGPKGSPSQKSKGPFSTGVSGNEPVEFTTTFVEYGHPRESSIARE